MLSSFLGFLLVISLVVFIHELGHYFAARLCGVRVLEFSIGFGKSIIQYVDKKKTKWKIALIPLGGYVKMYGDANPSSSSHDSSLTSLTEAEKSETFAFQTPLKRMFIAFSGPASNYILSILIFALFYSINGKVFMNNIVGEVIHGGPAYNIGIKSGDQIISIEGQKTETFNKIYSYVSLRPNQELNFQIKRKNEISNMKIRISEREIRDKDNNVIGKVGVLGIKSSQPEVLKVSFLGSIYQAFDDAVLISKMTLTSLAQIVTGVRSMEEIKGAITIADQSGKSLSNGFEEFFIFVAMISINIGFINLLPIPILDGGHIILCFYEIIARKKPSERVMRLLNSLGLLFIIFMFVISTSNDIKALISR